MLILGTCVCVGEDRAIVAVFEGRDPRGIRAKCEQHDVVHQPPVIRDLRGNTISRPGAIGRCQARLPTTGLTILTSPLDPPLYLVNTSEVLLKTLSIGDRESVSQRTGIFKHGIHNAQVAAVVFRAEETVKGQGRPRFRPSGRHRRAPRNVRTVEQRMPVLKPGDRPFTTKHQRRQPSATANPLCHQLVKADTRVHLSL